jgi:hypothetical protein
MHAHPALFDPRAEVRLRAAQALAHEDHPVLAELCASDDHALATFALRYGARRDKRWFPSSLDRAAKDHDDPRVRAVAVVLRVKLHGPEAAADALADESGRVRASGVVQLRDDEDLLRDVAATDLAFAPRLAALDALARLGHEVDADVRRETDALMALAPRARLELLEEAAYAAPTIVYPLLHGYARNVDRPLLRRAVKTACALTRHPRLVRRYPGDPSGALVTADRLMRYAGTLAAPGNQKIWGGLRRTLTESGYVRVRATPWRVLFAHPTALSNDESGRRLLEWMNRVPRPRWLLRELDAAERTIDPGVYRALRLVLDPPPYRWWEQAGY